MNRLGLLCMVILMAAAACADAGREAPAPAQPDSVCISAFCLAYPGDWEIVDRGDDFVSFTHPDGEGAALATIGHVSMEGIVAAAGEQWPQLTEDVARAFWEIIDGGDADLATIETNLDGSVRTFGSVSTGRLWWQVIATSFSDAIGLEVRAPNRSWEVHADAFFAGLTLLD